ncbi:hypothetical protein WJX84_011274 [Apatococcus fuscideae]
MLQVSVGHCGRSQAARLEGLAMLPGVTLRITPLLTKRICPVPLALHLAQISARPHSNHQQARPSTGHQPGPTLRQNGILTLDQARNLLPILVSDPMAYLVPSVGIWLSGVTGPDDPAVWAAAISFLATSQLQEKLLTPDKAFLVLLYTAEQAVDESTPRAGPLPTPHASPVPHQGHAHQLDLTPFKSTGAAAVTVKHIKALLSSWNQLTD